MPRLVVAALLSLSLSSGTALAATPQIVDQAGDANGLNGQWYDPAMLGKIAQEVRDIFLGGDPFGEGRPTPGSYAPADLRSVTLETEYTRTAVGADGWRHRPTALRIRFRTEDPAAAPHGATPLRLELHATLGPPFPDGCSSAFHIDVEADGTLSFARWFRWEDCRWNTGASWGSFQHPAWTATRGADATEVIVRIPFASLTEEEHALLGPGAALRELQATTQLWPPFTFDVTHRASGFVVGEDVPPDVPCTRDCGR
ncbi:MAG TPA: hypothetical protein VM638_05980 [Actinomycetota bacterium]|nr:hypothetical protein [Actinomycetota bacterium]